MLARPLRRAPASTPRVVAEHVLRGEQFQWRYLQLAYGLRHYYESTRHNAIVIMMLPRPPYAHICVPSALDHQHTGDEGFFAPEDGAAGMLARPLRRAPAAHSPLVFLQNMFREATSFNSDISGWETDSVTNIKDMLESATSFDQDLTGWDLSSIDDVESMFKKPPLPPSAPPPSPPNSPHLPGRILAPNDELRLAVALTYEPTGFGNYMSNRFAGWEGSKDPSTLDTSLVTDMSVCCATTTI